MKIHLDYRNPTPSHCDVAVYLDGALTGVLRLRQDEVLTFQTIIVRGMSEELDSFIGTGNPDAPEGMRNDDI